MKSIWATVKPFKSSSLPVREVWIEIAVSLAISSNLSSLPVREVWIEIAHIRLLFRTDLSLPVREVWIEIAEIAVYFDYLIVTSREGSVD